MAKFGQPKFIVVVMKNDKYMRVINKNNVEWIDDPKNANLYASKYAAKNHLKVLTIPTESVEYIALDQ